MRQLLAGGLAVAVAVSGGAVIADPTVPQINPLHRQREDAQRLTDQQRGLERPPPVAEPPVAQPPPSSPPPSGGRNTRGAGLVLLGIAGLSASVGLPLLLADSPTSSADRTTYDDTTTLLLVTSAITGGLGILLLAADRTVRVAPAVSSHGAGIAIMGRL